MDKETAFMGQMRHETAGRFADAEGRVAVLVLVAMFTQKNGVRQITMDKVGREGWFLCSHTDATSSPRLPRASPNRQACIVSFPHRRRLPDEGCPMKIAAIIVPLNHREQAFCNQFSTRKRKRRGKMSGVGDRLCYRFQVLIALRRLPTLREIRLDQLPWMHK